MAARYKEITVPGDIRTEHFLHIFQKHQSQLGQSLPDFVSVYLPVNIPPYQTKMFGCGNAKDEKTIELT